MRFRLLALDIDGTLLRSDRAVSPRTRAALARARAWGVHLVLVTGRRYPSALPVAEQLGDPVPLVVHNGALIVEAGRVRRCLPLARATALRAIRAGRQANADPVVHLGQAAEGRLQVESVNPANTLLAHYLDRARSEVTVVGDLILGLAEDPIQVMFGGPLDEMDRLFGAMREALGGEARVERTRYPARGVGLLDVLHPEVGKAGAVAFLQELLGVSVAETLAVGDNWNDREMLERAGLGLVMGNAEPALRSLGLPLLPTNDEDGVALAVETYLLP